MFKRWFMTLAAGNLIAILNIAPSRAQQGTVFEHLMSVGSTENVEAVMQNFYHLKNILQTVCASNTPSDDETFLACLWPKLAETLLEATALPGLATGNPRIARFLPLQRERSSSRSLQFGPPIKSVLTLGMFDLSTRALLSKLSSPNQRLDTSLRALRAIIPDPLKGNSIDPRLAMNPALEVVAIYAWLTSFDFISFVSRLHALTTNPELRIFLGQEGTDAIKSVSSGYEVFLLTISDSNLGKYVLSKNLRERNSANLTLTPVAESIQIYLGYSGSFLPGLYLWRVRSYKDYLRGVLSIKSTALGQWHQFAKLWDSKLQAPFTEYSNTRNQLNISAVNDLLFSKSQARKLKTPWNLLSVIGKGNEHYQQTFEQMAKPNSLNEIRVEDALNWSLRVHLEWLQQLRTKLRLQATDLKNEYIKDLVSEILLHCLVGDLQAITRNPDKVDTSGPDVAFVTEQLSQALVKTDLSKLLRNQNYKDPTFEDINKTTSNK